MRKKLIPCYLFFCSLITLVVTSCNQSSSATKTLTPQFDLMQQTTYQAIPAIESTDVKAPAASLPSNVQFLDVSLKELGHWEWGEMGTNVYFRDPAIYVLNKDIIFLYGAVDRSLGSMRSLLLRTGDGGQHWQEVMYPILGNNVLFVTFVDDNHGWALTAWVIESLVDITVQKTSDGGKNWEEAAYIENGRLGKPISLEFYDEMNGKILMKYVDRYSIFATNDGGTTWQEDISQTVNKEVNFSFQRWPYSRGFDGTECRFDIVGDREWSQLDLYRRVAYPKDIEVLQNPWMLISTLPLNYELQDGKVVFP